MKKVTKILALSLALIMSVMMFASCALFQAKPAKDPADAEKALEDNGYNVTLVEDLGDVEAMITATKDGETISITWFKESADAKEAYNEAKDALKEAKDELKEQKDELEELGMYDEMKEMLDNAVVGKSGNMVWSASSKDAVKAAK